MQQVQSLLKTLNLQGMAEALEGTCAHACAQALSLEEGLLLLAQSEKEHRDLKKSHALQRKAEFRNSACIENWDHGFERGLSRQKLRELSSLQFMQQKKNLLILGPTGVGKTQLAIALGRAACHNKLSVSFMSTYHFFEEYTLAQSTGKTIAWIKKISKPDLLILDDFALRSFTHHEATVLLEVLEERFQKGSFVVTSQVDPSGWQPLFEDKAIADAILDRILGPSTKVVLKGNSYRSHLGEESKGQAGQKGEKK